MKTGFSSKRTVRIGYFLNCVVICFMASCTKGNLELKMALSYAGDNRKELENVLRHYENDPQKLEAARFLISNMSGSYSINPQCVDDCQLFYETYDSLNQAYQFQIDDKWGNKVDSLWGGFERNHPISNRQQADLQVIKADYLIREIDLAFRAWQENVYSRECSFSDFCEYILPYRRINGIVADNAREVFYKRHHGKFFSKKGADFEQEMDSLLFQYSHIVHSQFWGCSIPVQNAATFEKLRRGLCFHRCWYNSLLFSSLGMATAIDFVPAWGNRANSHSWNVVIVNGKSYAFEPFWDDDRWRYKHIYNNRTIDKAGGKFRLPKIYRYTFSNHREGPMTDEDVDRQDIPQLFLNTKQKDVSSEYFEGKDVELTLAKNAPEGTKYAYLAVYGEGSWHPVQWGKMKGDKVVFKGMGKDIVYLPVYYKSGRIIPASTPFLLKTDGSMKALVPTVKTGRVATRFYTWTRDYGQNLKYLKAMVGTEMYGLKNGKEAERVCRIDSLLFERSFQPTETQSPFRFVRLKLLTDSITLGELAFYTEKGRIKNPKVISKIVDYGNDSHVDYLTDGLDGTVYRGKTTARQVDIDLGQEYKITKIGITPCLFSGIKPSDQPELMYWKDDSWYPVNTSCDRHADFIIFEKVPENTLLLLKKDRAGRIKNELMFTTEDGSIEWK